MNNLSKPANSNSSETKPLILIVEDDLNYLKVLEENFKSGGFPVHLVANPLKALNQIKKINPAVILINIQMRQLSGERIIKVLRTHKINTPIIVYTETISKEMIIGIK